ncbi:MAG: hypothetical protein KAT49_05380 [Methanomicrobia archaeon]|nr:hypothetical protein [Methanomicrobia archaeon]
MNEMEEMKLFEEYERDADWFQENFDSLADKYEGQIVAVKNKKILVTSRSVDDLIRKIKEMGEDPAVTYVKPIPPKDILFIL